MISSLKLKATLTALAVAALLAACGGGGNGITLNLKGTAATGLAIDGGTVNVQCKSGTGSATSSSTGTYTVIVTNGEGPCLVTVTKGDLTLRSIAEPDSSGQAVANITPITNAIVNAIAAAKGTTVDGLIGAQAPTPAEVSTAADKVVEVLNTALTNAGWSGEPLTAAQLLSDPGFTAATTANPDSGSVLDQAMDTLVEAGKLNDGQLDSTITEEIDAAVNETIDPTPTGGTGGSPTV